MKRFVILAVAVTVLAGCGGQTAEEYLQLATESAAAGQYNQAVIYFKNALQQNPEYAEARARLGILYETGGDYESAIKELERAAELGYPEEDLQVALLRSRVRTGDHKQVLQDLRGVAQDPELLAIRGMAFQAGGDFDRAAAEYAKALEVDPATVVALVGAAQLSAADAPEEALRLVSQATEADPANRDAWLIRGQLEQSLGQHAAAIDSYNRVAELPNGAAVGAVRAIEATLQNDALAMEERLDLVQPRLQDTLRRFPRYAPALFMDGFVANLQGDRDRALNALRQAESANPDFGPTLFLMGVILFEEEQFNQSRQYLERFLQIAPGESEQTLAATKVLATIHLQADRAQDAVDVLSRRSESLDAQGLAMLGDAYRRTGDAANASRYLQEAVEKAPDVAAFRQTLAISLLGAGEGAQAREELESLVDLGVEVEENRELLLRMHLVDGDREAAEQIASEVLEQNADDPQGHYLFGVIEFASGNLEAAASRFEQALEKDATFAPALEGRARVAVQQGDRENALSYYQELLDVAPGNEHAGVALAVGRQADGDTAGAIDILEGVAENNPLAVEVRRILVNILLAEGRYPETEEYAAEALELAPSNPLVQLAKAASDAANGRTAEATRSLQQMRNSDDDMPREAYLLLAQLQQSNGLYRPAAAALEEWHDDHPDDDEVAVLLGNAELQFDPESAAGRFEALAERAEDGTAMQAAVINNLAIAYDQLGDPRAEATARQVRALRPDDPAVADTLGWILAKNGNLDEAVDLLQTAAQKTNDNPTVVYHLAWAMAENGDVSGARDRVETLLEDRALEFPERSEAESLLRSLESN